MQCPLQGFVITDWEGIDRISDPPGSNYRECVMLGINAGIDMVMVPFKFEILWNDLLSLAESGEIPMARIDDAVERILRVKFITGVFDHPFTDRSLLDMVGCKAHRELAREAVRMSRRSLLQEPTLMILVTSVEAGHQLGWELAAESQLVSYSYIVGGSMMGDHFYNIKLFNLRV
nr:Glycosyl hydrolase family protein [Ipomoea batatas]